ncbi:hypothetical protein AVEN_63474-1 [Araneus ventricosus]|uniref:Uncharacterized protein n=1 Tax=Araneus ventricosus TaxID=182803 RepID=A0A4Y2CRF1_ARAVE|nr:hypothetical protein AVEN_63474-1 [Araneus ventricosus]
MSRTTPEPVPLSPNFRATPEGGHLDPTELTCTIPAHMAILRWNRVSSLEHSSLEAETLLSRHRGQNFVVKPIQIVSVEKVRLFVETLAEIFHYHYVLGVYRFTQRKVCLITQ